MLRRQTFVLWLRLAAAATLVLGPGARAETPGAKGWRATLATAAPSAPPAHLDPAEAQRLINDYRRQRGLKPLEINARLAAAAAGHSADLARRDTISHQGSDGSDHWIRIKRTGYVARYTAENVGVGQKSIGELIAGWRRSPPHNANLLSTSARQMGIALACRPGARYKTYWTLVLGAPYERPVRPVKQARPSKPRGKAAKAAAGTAPTAAVKKTP